MTTSVFDQSPINPFISILLKTVEFDSVLLETDQIFVNDYENDISLVPHSPGMHMPLSLWSYMTDNFFQYICKEPGTLGNPESYSSYIVPLKTCRCIGTDFFGMPDIQFVLNVNGYDIDYFYEMKPFNYELFPRVNNIFRYT